MLITYIKILFYKIHRNTPTKTKIYLHAECSLWKSLILFFFFPFFFSIFHTLFLSHTHTQIF